MKKHYLITTLIAFIMSAGAKAGPLDKSSPKIAHKAKTDINGHLLVESSGIKKGSKPRPAAGRGIKTDIGGHLQVQSTGIKKGSKPRFQSRTIGTRRSTSARHRTGPTCSHGASWGCSKCGHIPPPGTKAKPGSSGKTQDGKHPERAKSTKSNTRKRIGGIGRATGLRR